MRRQLRKETSPINWNDCCISGLVGEQALQLRKTFAGLNLAEPANLPNVASAGGKIGSHPGICPRSPSDTQSRQPEPPSEMREHVELGIGCGVQPLPGRPKHNTCRRIEDKKVQRDLTCELV